MMLLQKLARNMNGGNDLFRISRLLMVALGKLTGGAKSREEQAPRDEGAQDQELENEHCHAVDAPHVVESLSRKMRKESRFWIASSPTVL